MRNLFSPESPLFSFGEQLFDMMAVSVLWAVCCVPIVTIGPATSALYYVIVKQVRRKTGSLWSNFFDSFRENMRIGVPLTSMVLIYTTVMAAIIWAKYVLPESVSSVLAGSFLTYVARVMLLPVLLVLPYLAPVLSRFSIGIGAVLKLSLVMSLRFLGRTIVLLAMVAGSAAVLWFVPFAIFALPGLCALGCSFLMEPVLRNYMPKPDPDQPIPWYWE